MFVNFNVPVTSPLPMLINAWLHNEQPRPNRPPPVKYILCKYLGNYMLNRAPKPNLSSPMCSPSTLKVLCIAKLPLFVVCRISSDL